LACSPAWFADRENPGLGINVGAGATRPGIGTQGFERFLDERDVVAVFVHPELAARTTKCVLDIAIDGKKLPDARHTSRGAFDARADAGHDLGGGSFAELAALGRRLALAPEITGVVEEFVFASFERLHAGAHDFLHALEIAGSDLCLGDPSDVLREVGRVEMTWHRLLRECSGIMPEG
jgi:hypothetical protein